MVENTVVLRPPRKGRTYVFGRVVGGFVKRWLGIRICFRHLWAAFVGRMLLRPYTCYMPYMKIRPCFPNRVHISVGDTAMFSLPMGGVCGAYAIRPYTCYMPYIEIRSCYSNWEYISVRDTDIFSERGIYFCWGYGNVFRTGYTLSIEI